MAVCVAKSAEALCKAVQTFRPLAHSFKILVLWIWASSEHHSCGKTLQRQSSWYPYLRRKVKFGPKFQVCEAWCVWRISHQNSPLIIRDPVTGWSESYQGPRFGYFPVQIMCSIGQGSLHPPSLIINFWQPCQQIMSASPRFARSCARNLRTVKAGLPTSSDTNLWQVHWMAWEPTHGAIRPCHDISRYGPRQVTLTARALATSDIRLNWPL